MALGAAHVQPLFSKAPARRIMAALEAKNPCVKYMCEYAANIYCCNCTGSTAEQAGTRKELLAKSNI